MLFNVVCLASNLALHNPSILTIIAVDESFTKRQFIQFGILANCINAESSTIGLACILIASETDDPCLYFSYKILTNLSHLVFGVELLLSVIDIKQLNWPITRYYSPIAPTAYSQQSKTFRLREVDLS